MAAAADRAWAVGDRVVVFNRSPADGDAGTVVDENAPNPTVKWLKVDISENYPDWEKALGDYTPLQHRGALVTPDEWKAIMDQIQVGDPVYGTKKTDSWQENLTAKPGYLGIAVDVSHRAYVGVKRDPDDPDEPVTWTYRYDARVAPEEQLLDHMKGISG